MNGEHRPIALDWSGEITQESLAGFLDVLDREVWPVTLPRQRWFGDKGRTITGVHTRPLTLDSMPGGLHELHALLEVAFSAGEPSTWFAPLVISSEPFGRPLASFKDRQEKTLFVDDGPANISFHRLILDGIEHGAIQGVAGGKLVWTTPGAPIAIDYELSRELTGEQSNSNIAYDETLLVKVIRRVQPGLSPEIELGRYLASRRDARGMAPRLIADWTLEIDGYEASVGVAQEFIRGGQDGWEWLLDALKRAGKDRVAQKKTIDGVRRLGKRVAQVHEILADNEKPGLEPIWIDENDIERWTSGTRGSIAQVAAALETRRRSLADESARSLVERLLERIPELDDSLDAYQLLAPFMKTRVHGDLHLGQTLKVKDEWVLLDFEGEPARSLEERRAHSSPLKDVAGMLRSIAYALAFASREPGAWTDSKRELERQFLNGYLAGGTDPDLFHRRREQFERMLTPWIVDKAVYEIAYELNNRPDWLWAPIASLLDFLDRR